MTTSTITPQRQGALPSFADHVGSLLRPAHIKQARNDVAAGSRSAASLRDQEDKAIRDLVAVQYQCGMRALTDGEIRRGWWHFDFLEQLTGVERYTPKQGYQFNGRETKKQNVRICGPLAFPDDHPFLDDFRFLNHVTQRYPEALAKQTIPSPNMLMHQSIRNNAHYDSLEQYSDALGATYAAALQAFYDAGCRYLQLDDVFWAYLADASAQEQERQAGTDIDELIAICARTLNIALAHKPHDMIVAMHVCRGNFASTWIYQGGYDRVAQALGSVNVDALFLEYDDPRSGDFSPLRHIKHQQVVLGLITSKDGALETKEAIQQRVLQAAEYLPLSQLALSPQCGFASTEEGNALDEAQQWAKLRHVIDIAHSIW